ncbi:MAG: hypothetical protein Ct9H300mP1_05670 [Planctomycetaceae bacterium]|nr:MAG: hypothetical protein Ct9H300mP1_05670 [Planctomycetaceae bacterium]
MATLNLHYARGLHAQVRVSWLSPVKVRRTMLGGSRRMIVYDDVEPSEKVKVYDKGVVWILTVRTSRHRNRFIEPET